MDNQSRILTYLSSSEINRCKKNGLNPFGQLSVSEWFDVFDSKWLTKKLKRKLKTLYFLNVLYIKNLPDIKISKLPMDELIGKFLLKQFLKAEDEYIMKGGNNG
jgi:hypothetical protein